MNLERIEAQVRAAIAAQGYHVVLVQAEGDEPAYGFTVGLWSTHRHPEVVSFGVDDGSHAGTMHHMLDLLAERVVAGERFHDGERVEDVIERYRCAVRAVHPARISEYLDFAARIHGGASFDCVQLVWPDAGGRFPWEEGFDRTLLRLQPLLDAPPGR